MEINILVSKLDEIKIRKNIKEIESSKKKKNSFYLSNFKL
jgi:hypothetical protein